jgi:integral membrane sensor domain MASE1
MAVFGVIVILAIAGVIIGGVVGAVIGATTTPFQLDPDAWVSGRGAQAYLGGVVGAALGACALAALWLLIDEERARRVRERRSPGK